MSVLDSIIRGGKKIMGNPGAALERIKGNAVGRAKSDLGTVKKGAGRAAMAATRGKGLKPARDLGKVLKEAGQNITK
jgi:hypothetical protein